MELTAAGLETKKAEVGSESPGISVFFKSGEGPTNAGDVLCYSGDALGTGTPGNLNLLAGGAAGGLGGSLVFDQNGKVGSWPVSGPTQVGQLLTSSDISSSTFGLKWSLPDSSGTGKSYYSAGGEMETGFEEGAVVTINQNIVQSGFTQGPLGQIDLPADKDLFFVMNIYGTNVVAWFDVGMRLIDGPGLTSTSLAQMERAAGSAGDLTVSSSSATYFHSTKNGGSTAIKFFCTASSGTWTSATHTSLAIREI
ncbi:MAG: hypothetical protein K0U20_09800 [Proteobacteria bacterium]|nr:hypothetical protein [Pseudomonadota bacterium]